jgi:isocitrate lyase
MKTSSDLAADWSSNPRWKGIHRPYSTDDVLKLRPSVKVEHTIADLTAHRLWERLSHGDFVATYGALSGSQAVQMVKGGLEAIYVSGWQVAADVNLAGETYPDQSLYPCNSVPALVSRINAAFTRADQVERLDGHKLGLSWYTPIVADAEAGFGGPLHAFELMKAMIEAGAAGVHFEDQLASEKKCGHLGGKVLVPTSQFKRVLTGARLAADVLGVPTLLVARTPPTSASSRASALPKAFTSSAAAWKPPSSAAWPTPSSPTCFGSRRQSPTWAKRASSRPRFTANTRASSSRTTARHPSTGSATSALTRSRSSRPTWPSWATASSS